MTELQKVELDIFEEFVKICDKLNLKYFLVCGSALGAVKYTGFIPWDDDLDVGLYRDDYNRFINEAQAFLPDKIFLQTYETDENYPNIFAKLRDCSTTYIEKSVSGLDMNHGVYIDIFPLDGYPVKNEKREKLEKKKKYYKRMLSCVFDVERSSAKKIIVKIMRFLKIHKKTRKYLRKYEYLISKYSVEKSDLICNHGNWQGKLEYSPKWHYGNGIMMRFEGLDVRVPENYDDYLTQKYGDWRADLPKEQQVGHHYYEICDLHRPYTDYIEKSPNGKIRIKNPNELK